MTSKRFAFLAGTLLCAFAAPTWAQSASDWVDIKDAKELQQLFSNRTFINPWGAAAHFRADGRSLTKHPGGTVVPSTWAVKGVDRVCVTPDKGETECWAVQRNRRDPNKVGFVMPGGWTTFNDVKDGVPQF